MTFLRPLRDEVKIIPTVNALFKVSSVEWLNGNDIDIDTTS